jgi:hypothetical protein
MPKAAAETNNPVPNSPFRKKSFLFIFQKYYCSYQGFMWFLSARSPKQVLT